MSTAAWAPRRGNAYRVEVYKGADGDWYWRFVCGANGKIMAASEGYHNRADAINSARTVTDVRRRPNVVWQVEP